MPYNGWWCFAAVTITVAWQKIIADFAAFHKICDTLMTALALTVLVGWQEEHASRKKT